MSKKDKGIPEHEKLKSVQADAQVIGDFIEWLSLHDLLIAEWIDKRDYPVPVRKSTADILADYFGINQVKLEAEKRQMLNDIRNHQAKLPPAKEALSKSR